MIALLIFKKQRKIHIAGNYSSPVWSCDQYANPKRIILIGNLKRSGYYYLTAAEYSIVDPEVLEPLIAQRCVYSKLYLSANKNPDAVTSSLHRGLKVAGTGFEHPPQSLGKTAFQGAGNAECNALSAGDVEIDSDLEMIVTVWPNLTIEMRRQLMKIINETENIEF